MSYEYIKRTYGLTFTPGDRVRHTVAGNIGTVKRGESHYVNVTFDGQRFSTPCHPQELKPAPDAE
jgi:hypothetical protein